MEVLDAPRHSASRDYPRGKTEVEARDIQMKILRQEEGSLIVEDGLFLPHGVITWDKAEMDMRLYDLLKQMKNSVS